MRPDLPELSVITPVFNEEVLILQFHERVCSILDRMDIDYEIIFVDDGSTDSSFKILKELSAETSGRLKIVRLARNFGHQIAITAGQRHASGNAVLVIDCDLQDPPELIPQFVEKWKEGFDIVYGIRTERKGETFLKRFTASLFYKILRKCSDVDIPADVGDFYLLDQKVVDVLNHMDECHRFLRGMIVWTGFRRFGIEYVRGPRFAGKTKFSFWKMVKFSLDAITSFSFMPLRFISLFGAFISFFAFLGIGLVIIVKVFDQTAVLGWASLMVSILFIGGIQILAIGIIGEYLARIGDDVKKRPLYIVDQVVGQEEADNE